MLFVGVTSELLPAIKELNIGGVAMKGHGCRGEKSAAMCLDSHGDGPLRSLDRDILGVHNGHAMGSIYLGGSDEQKQKWLRPMATQDTARSQRKVTT